MGKTRDDLIAWLHRLDAYTNAEFGSARSLAALREACVACGALAADCGPAGLCRRCMARRAPEAEEIRLFRAVARSPRPA